MGLQKNGLRSLPSVTDYNSRYVAFMCDARVVGAFWDEWSKRKYLDETTATLLALPRNYLHEQLLGVDSFIQLAVCIKHAYASVQDLYYIVVPPSC